MISPSWAPTLTDVASVGGKAASLFRLIMLGARVPPFFVLTADAFRAHPEGRLSPEAVKEILAASATLGIDESFAVRSSGIAEDSAENSFAGVFDTLLDVRGADGIVQAIEACWHSHRSDRAASYRLERDVEGDEGMAVIVQRMIAAKWAGVSFTADPVSQALSVVVVNAVEGGGDALVSGLVNPEEIKVDRGMLAILERSRPPGTSAFPDQILFEVVRTSISIADELCFPQDLEWAFDGDLLYLLQSRPITTMAGVVHNRPLEPADDIAPDAPERIWTRAYADEVWTPPVSPLFYDVQNLTHHLRTRLGHDGDTRPIPADIFKYYRAAPYADAAVLGRVYGNLPPVARRPSLLAQLPAEQQAAVAAAPWRVGALLHRFWIFEIRNRRRWSFAHNHRFLERSWDGFLASAETIAATDLPGLGESALDKHIEDIWALALSVGVECEIAVLYHAHDLKLLLSGLLDRWLDAGDEIYAAVSAGLPDSQTVRESDEIWGMAEQVRQTNPALADQIRERSFAEFSAAPAAGSETFLHAFQAFLHRHRHRGANYKDLIHPRWGDDPELLWNHLKSFIASPGTRPGLANGQAGASRQAAQQAALAALAGWRATYRRPVLKRLLKANEIYSALRDNHRFYYDHVWWLLRRSYREIGHRLGASARLAKADDVFFLSRKEIEGLRNASLAPAEAQERILVRRREWRETRLEQPPKFLRGGYVPFIDRSPAAEDFGLKGIPASAGDVTARARIAHDIADLNRLEAGEILVTRQTDPGWTPAFSRLAGLVLETGGTLAHGASLCREFGLPCVTAVERATSLIRDGDLIRLSGGDGIVEILERAESGDDSARIPRLQGA